MADSHQAADIHFGTDGWRAIIGEDFNPLTVLMVSDAAARAYRMLLDGQIADHTEADNYNPGTVYVGYDCRLDAGRYAALVATAIAAQGFKVVVTDRYCPTPALCWTVAHDDQAVGGLMLTASHNPADYLGIKLRMSDGGASPAWFSDIVEALLTEELPHSLAPALAAFEAAHGGTPDQPSTNLPTTGQPSTNLPTTDQPATNLPATDQPITNQPQAAFRYQDIMSDYLQDLVNQVDHGLIHSAGLSVVVDPMYGSGRGYLVNILRSLGVVAYEVNGTADTTFAGLHPEPIRPWVNTGAEKVAELGYAACLITDGDADRIGAVDGNGKYVTSHRIVSLLIAHLVEGRGLRGRIVRTSAGSNLIKRQCQRLGLELTTRPIGFKWVYEEMLKGDVLIGGEESGGFGIPTHVRERDGLLMALLLVEMMASRSKTLAELVEELLQQVGTLEYGRRDLRLSEAQKAVFLSQHVNVAGTDYSPYSPLFTSLNEEIFEIERVDGIMIRFVSDAWLLARPSGTEPLVRVYAEAANDQRVQELLDIGCAMAEGLL